MPTTLLIIKLFILAIVLFFHHLQQRHIKGIVLAFLIWVGIPDGTDLLIQPVFAEITGLSFPLSAIVYFGVVWISIFIIWRFT